jgi:hypothetical protein
MREAEPRFVGLDLHRHDVMVGAVNAQQAIVLTPQRVTLRHFAQWVPPPWLRVIENDSTAVLF